MHAGSTSTLLLFAALATTPAACSSRTSADAETGSSSGSGTGAPTDEELRATCAAGCVKFQSCAPDAYMAAYEDDAACEAYCFELFDAPDDCRAASVDYAACTGALACVDWPDLLNDPATSKCAASWAPVAAACPVP